MTPSQRHAIARFRDAEGDLAALTTQLDIAETKAAIALGKPNAWTPETELEFITATLEWRK